MSNKLRPRLRPVRVKLTRDRSTLPLTPPKAIVTEPDCPDTALLDSLEENMQKSGEKLRNLSLCLDGTLAGRERVYPRLSARACIRPSSQRDLRLTRDHSEDSSDLRPPNSSALQREERRADQLCAAFQAIGPVVSEIAERLRRTEEGHRLEEELSLARETIANLTKDVEQLNAEVKLLCDRNEALEHSHKAQENTLISLSHACESLEKRLNSSETRLKAVLSSVLADLRDVEVDLGAKCSEEQRLMEENARLQAVLRLTEDFSNGELSRLIVENQNLREENANLEAKQGVLGRENDDLGAELDRLKKFSAIEAEKERFEQESSKQTQQIDAKVQLQAQEIALLKAKTAEMAVSHQLQHIREGQFLDEMFLLREKLKNAQEICAVYEDQARTEAFREKNRLFRSKKALSVRVIAASKREEEEERERNAENRDMKEDLAEWKQGKREIQGLDCRQGGFVWGNEAFRWTLRGKQYSSGQKERKWLSGRPVCLAAAAFLIQRSSSLAARMWKGREKEGEGSRKGTKDQDAEVNSALDLPF